MLTEIDGAEENGSESVLIIGATNWPYMLDSAILRPGRFDELIYVALPNYEAWLSIF